eukprot:3382545-Ditylum_brightwellii.AAC.1
MRDYSMPRVETMDTRMERPGEVETARGAKVDIWQDLEDTDLDGEIKVADEEIKVADEVVDVVDVVDV